MSNSDRYGLVSRRAVAVRAGLGAGLGLAFAGRGWAALAADATPAAKEELPPAEARFVAAMAAADADQIAASYTAEGVLEEVGFGQTFTGQDAIRDDEATFLNGFSDVTIEIPTAFACGEWAAAEFFFTGTYSGEIPGLPPGAGQDVMLRGASILQFNDEGIVRHNQYFDAYGFLVQVGALPAPGSEEAGMEAEATPAA